MNKNYITNISLIGLTLILIVTFKATLFYHLTYYTYLLGFDDLNNVLTNFYKTYLFKPISSDDNFCNFCFEVLFKFNFDNTIFKFALLFLTLLLLIKRNTRDYRIKKEDYFVLPLLIFSIVFIQKDIFLVFVNLNLDNLSHFLQYIVYFIIYFEFFVLLPLIILFAYTDTKFNLYLKILFIISLNYFIYYHIFYSCHFLSLTLDEINNIGYSQGLNYILNSYGIGVECMHSKINIFHPKGTSPCSYYKYMLDYNCKILIPKDINIVDTYTQQCKIIEEEFRKTCIDTLRQTRK